MQKLMDIIKKNKVFFLPLVTLFMSSCMDLAENGSKERAMAARNIHYRQGQVYTMRGLGGIFSRGMNRLENTLEEEYHIRTDSTIWYKAKVLSNYITEHYRDKTLTGPIILIGHSLGANEQIKVAKYLNEANIPVDLLMTIDAVSPINVPPNVKETFNIYKPGFIPMFSGLKLQALFPETTKIENFNVADIKGVYVNHFTLDKHKAIQKIMLDKVLETLNYDKTRNRQPSSTASVPRLATEIKAKSPL